MTEDIRKLVTVRQIDEVVPIEGADRICAYRIGGWNVVDRKGAYSVGDWVLFFEVDSALPVESVAEFEFLKERTTRTITSPVENKSILVHVLKTIRLKGVYSQGLILPLSWGLDETSSQEDVNETMRALGVFKYEKPTPASSPTKPKGNFPAWLRKTDSERVQNLNDRFLQSLDPNEWTPTVKRDGSSLTAYKTEEGVFGICSRNWDLKVDDGGSIYHQAAAKYNLENLLPNGTWLQAEVYGAGVQADPLKVGELRIAVFDASWMWGKDNSHARYMDSSDAAYDDLHNLPKVPILDLTLPTTVKEAIEQAEGLKDPEFPNRLAEGIVWHNVRGKTFNNLGHRGTFKAINNKYLTKHG